MRFAKSILAIEKDLSGRSKENRIIRYQCYIRIYSKEYHEFIRILGRLLLIASRSIFYDGRASCVLRVNRISCSCGISPVQASRERERERGSGGRGEGEGESQFRSITGMLKLNSNMRRHWDSENYERLFSITISDLMILLVTFQFHDINSKISSC